MNTDEKTIKRAEEILWEFFDFLVEKKILSWRDVDHEVFSAFMKTKTRLGSLLEPKDYEELYRFWNAVRDEYCLKNDIDFPERPFKGGESNGKESTA